VPPTRNGAYRYSPNKVYTNRITSDTDRPNWLFGSPGSGLFRKVSPVVPDSTMWVGDRTAWTWPGRCGARSPAHTSAPGFSTWPPYEFLRVDSDESLDRRAPFGSTPTVVRSTKSSIPNSDTHTARTSHRSLLSSNRDFVHTIPRFDNLGQQEFFNAPLSLLVS
jgi:hypothetical protein